MNNTEGTDAGRNKPCPKETELMTQLKKGGLTKEMEAHSAQCPVCSDTIMIHRWMGDFNKTAEKYDAAHMQLPDPDMLWEKAQTSAGLTKEMVEKALRPLMIPKALTYLSVIIGIGVLVFSDGSLFGEFFVTDFGSDLGSDLGSGYLAGFLQSMGTNIAALLRLTAIPLGTLLVLGAAYYFITEGKTIKET